MKNPKFSIIIPTRNRKKLLELAIKSVLNQDYENYEVIVHDNNSQDGTDMMLRKLRNKKLRFYRSSRDLTMHENWNKAFSYVTGDYFIRLDDDNLFCSDLLERYKKAIEEHNYDIVVGYPITLINKNSFKLYFDLDTTQEINLFQWLLLDLKMLTDSNYVAYNTKLTKKIFHENIIYKTSVPDRYMNLELMNSESSNRIKIGLTTDVVGVTRYDYERQSIDNNKLGHIDVNTIFKDENIKKIVLNTDCRGLHFTTHLLLNVIYFQRNNAKNNKIVNFINTNIYSEQHYKTVILINQLNSQQKIDLFENYGTIFSIIQAFLFHPKLYLYGKPAYRFIYDVLYSGLVKILKRKRSMVEQVNRGDSDTIVKSLLNKKHINFKSQPVSQNGDINDLLMPFTSH